MNAEIINLRNKRKQKKRKEKDKASSENRALFGESKGIKSQRLQEKEKLQRTVEGARRDPETND